MRTYELKIRDKEFKIKVKSFSLDNAELEIDGETLHVDVKNIGDELEGRLPVRPLPTSANKAPVGTSAPKSAKKAVAGAGAVIAPIPGAIMEIFVKEGDVIKAGQPVLKMEAMKMENIINSDIEGTVMSISVNPGDAVSQGEELLTIG